MGFSAEKAKTFWRDNGQLHPFFRQDIYKELSTKKVSIIDNDDDPDSDFDRPNDNSADNPLFFLPLCYGAHLLKKFIRLMPSSWQQTAKREASLLPTFAKKNKINWTKHEARALKNVMTSTTGILRRVT